LEGNPLIVWTTAISFWDDLLDPLKITFDGDNKQIIINEQYNTISVKTDIYSAAKRWLQRRQNLNYLNPIRCIGGDPITGGLYAGDIYFLENNWQVIVNTQITVAGTLYNDNTSLNVFIINSGGGVTATTSNLAYAYNTSGVTVPTAADNAAAVWGVNPASYGTSTAAGKLNKIDTIDTNSKTIVALTS
jgi:hypothetical protein